jgi:hypothetical protein
VGERRGSYPAGNIGDKLMEPYYAMMDLRIFLSPAFLELSMDAQTRFVQLVGTSDRMGVGNLYYVWNESRIKADLMDSLYKSDLVWPVDAYYCFIPSVFNANRKMRNGKYRSSFDTKGFQACIDKYPELLQSMTDSEKEYIKQHGILTGETTEVLPETQKAQAIEYKQTCDEEISKDPSNYINFEGVYMDRKDYAKYQALTMLYKDFEERNNVSILTEKDVAEWFMNLYSNDYRHNGTKVNDLKKLFLGYLEKVMQNKRIQGTLVARGGYV